MGFAPRSFFVCCNLLVVKLSARCGRCLEIVELNEGFVLPRTDGILWPMRI